MPFTQNGPNVSASLGNYNDVQGDQDNTYSRTIRTIIRGSQNQTYRANNITIINIDSDLVAEPSVQHILQAVTRTPSATAQRPLRYWQQQVIVAADDASRLTVSISRLLALHMESFDSCRDLKLSLELLYDTIVMSRLAALEIFEPRDSDLASTIEPAILECRGTLQELFAKFQGYQEGRGVTGVPWNHTPRRFQRQELCRIKKRLEMHLVALMEFLELTSISWTNVSNDNM